MLVLSRKENEKVLFPNLGIALQILRVDGGKVRLGVEAPRDVSVVRSEIASEEQIEKFARRLQNSAGELSHQTRNKLQTVVLALYLIQKQLDKNLIPDAEATLAHLVSEMQGLDLEVGLRSVPALTSSALRVKALVVEDNSNEQRLLAGYLSLAGYEVHAVDDGLEALDYLASHERPDVVLMDMQLPRLGGAAAVNVLRSDPRFQGLMVYAVSGMDRDEARVPVGPNGVNHWFRKPLDPRQLVERINREISTRAVPA